MSSPGDAHSLMAELWPTEGDIQVEKRSLRQRQREKQTSSANCATVTSAHWVPPVLLLTDVLRIRFCHLKTHRGSTLQTFYRAKTGGLPRWYLEYDSEVTLCLLCVTAASVDKCWGLWSIETVLSIVLQNRREYNTIEQCHAKQNCCNNIIKWLLVKTKKNKKIHLECLVQPWHCVRRCLDSIETIEEADEKTAIL